MRVPWASPERVYGYLKGKYTPRVVTSELLGLMCRSDIE